MDRRTAVRTLGSAMAMPVMGGAHWDPTTSALFQSARAALFTPAYVFRTLSSRQAASVSALADLIIPKTETPGASEAGVPEFVDLILTDWFTGAETARFLNGLDTLEAETRAAHGIDFVDVDYDAQMTTLERLDAELQELLRAADADSALDPMAAPTESVTPGPDPTHHFMYQLKRLTLTGYFTSEPGMVQDLEYQVIPGRYDGCADRE